MELSAGRLRAIDLFRLGWVALRARRVRSLLSALGIAIGIASMVAVLGISASSRAGLLAQLDRLGTNLLTVKPGQTMLGEDANLPREAAAMSSRVGPVQQVARVRYLDASVRRTNYIDEAETGGIRVMAADVNLLKTLAGSLKEGTFLNSASARYPTVVLGATAARRLGISQLAGKVRVWIGDRWFTVVGILEPIALAPDIDTSVIVGLPASQKWLGADDHPSAIYVRADPESIEAVRGVLARTVNPEHPEEVEVTRPSDALEARAAAKDAFTSLFLGLGAVALVVGGIGIANVMVISVLERRREIGLRRALGATRRHVALQFLSESLLLSVCGGALGMAIGSLITMAYASKQGWDVVVPLLALAMAAVLSAVLGGVAGLYPAMRAARLPPTEALRTV